MITTDPNKLDNYKNCCITLLLKIIIKKIKKAFRF